MGRVSFFLGLSEKCLVGLTSILKEAWNAAERSKDVREKVQALSLAKDCYGMKLELLTNATVVDDAMRFVSSHANRKNMKIDEGGKKVQKDEIAASRGTKDFNTSHNTTF